jgi:hypothetical protein
MNVWSSGGVCKVHKSRSLFLYKGKDLSPSFIYLDGARGSVVG